MNLRGLTVCVNYSDLLARSIVKWKEGLERLIVVTSTADLKTQALCRQHGVETHVTDVFYQHGARFNKGAAMSEAIICTRLRQHAQWLLMFDSDIVPPDDWRLQLGKQNLRQGTLYGAHRYWQPENAAELRVEPDKRMPQGWVIGFFCMFHVLDPRVPKDPIFEIDWPHAGNYDTIFTRRWHRKRQQLLRIPFIHLGEERSNWLGRGNKDELDAMLEARGHKLSENWEKERMPVKPILRGPA